MEFWPIFDIFHRLRPYLCSKREVLGFHKQATHRRRGDEPFFYFGVHRSWLGMAQKWSTLDQKWPNMAGLSTFQSGPKGSKRDQNDQPKCFWPFGTVLGPSGHFWTISDKNEFFVPNGQSRVWRRCFRAKNHFLFEMVQKGPDGPKRVPNGQKHLGWPFWSLLDPFGPLWNADRPAMFGQFGPKWTIFWTSPAPYR